MLNYFSLLNWNMSYSAITAMKLTNLDHFSPIEAVSTPSDVAVATPHSNNATSPQRVVPSLSRALERKIRTNRVQLFLQGRHDELMKSMTKSERLLVANFMLNGFC